MRASEAPPARGAERRPRRASSRRALRHRYTTADLAVLSREESRRFVADGPGDPQLDQTLAWELLYRLEPELYDRLVSAERLHPGILEWLPRGLERIVEVGAGTGRLTLELLARAREVVAVEPAAPLRAILERKLQAAEGGHQARVIAGYFDRLPLEDRCADLVVACSAFTPAAGHGGDGGLAEMERVCRPGGCVAIVWPNNLDWLAARGYHHVSFDGAMTLEFASVAEARELGAIFFPQAGSVDARVVPYEALGVNPPRDIAFKAIAARP